MSVSLIDGHIDDTPGMTDNEIIKALEGKQPLGMCAIRGAIDLINRQKAEIERLENALFKQEDTMQMIVKERDAEIERLNFVRTRDAQRYEQKISDQSHTNCVLYDLHSDAIKEVKALEDELKTAKAEAIKEFAERLNNSLYKASPNPTFEDEIMIIVDKLVKEMVGDN